MNNGHGIMVSFKKFKRQFQTKYSHYTRAQLSELIPHYYLNINIIQFLLKKGAQWNDTNSRIMFRYIDEKQFEYINRLYRWFHCPITSEMVDRLYQYFDYKTKRYVKTIKNLLYMWKDWFLENDCSPYPKFEAVKQNWIKN